MRVCGKERVESRTRVLEENWNEMMIIEVDKNSYIIFLRSSVQSRFIFSIRIHSTRYVYSDRCEKAGHADAKMMKNTRENALQLND